MKTHMIIKLIELFNHIFHYIVIQNSFIIISFYWRYIYKMFKNYLLEHYIKYLLNLSVDQIESKRNRAFIPYLSSRRLRNLPRIMFKNNNIIHIFRPDIFYNIVWRRRKGMKGSKTTNTSFRCLLSNKDYLWFRISGRSPIGFLSLMHLLEN